MNRNRSTAAAACVGLILLTSGWAAAQGAEPPRARVRLPIAGTAAKGKATFTGTLSIERFAIRGENSDKIVAIGMVTGKVTDKSGNPLGTVVVGQVEVPVRVDESLRPGLTFMTLHFQDEVATNLLTIDATDRL